MPPHLPIDTVAIFFAGRGRFFFDCHAAPCAKKDTIKIIEMTVASVPILFIFFPSTSGDLSFGREIKSCVRYWMNVPGRAVLRFQNNSTDENLQVDSKHSRLK